MSRRHVAAAGSRRAHRAVATTLARDVADAGQGGPAAAAGKSATPPTSTPTPPSAATRATTATATAVASPAAFRAKPPPSPVTRLLTPLTGTDTLLFRRFTGTEEIDRLHAWEVDVVSRNPALDPQALLGRHGTVVVALDDDEWSAAAVPPPAVGRHGGDGPPSSGAGDGWPPNPATGARHLDGLITRFGMQEGPVEMLRAAPAAAPVAHFPYRLLLRPWLWLATQRGGVRLFEGMSVPAIVARVLAPYGHALSMDRLARHHPPRPRTLQCGETDFDFIARLCEDDHLHWFFEHRAGGHRLVFVDGDGPGAYRPLPGGPVIPFLAASPSQAVVAGPGWSAQPAVAPPHVDYWAMGREAVPGIPRESTHGEPQARSFHAHLNQRRIAPGHTMVLQGHPQPAQNQAYLVVAVDYQLEESGVPGEGGGRREGDGGSSVQRFAMEVQPAAQPFRPPRTAPRPQARGPQVGVVAAVDAGGGQVKVRLQVAASASRDAERPHIEPGDQVSDWLSLPTHPHAHARHDDEPRDRPQPPPVCVGDPVLVDFVEGDPEQPFVLRWGPAGASFVVRGRA